MTFLIVVIESPVISKAFGAVYLAYDREKPLANDAREIASSLLTQDQSKTHEGPLWEQSIFEQSVSMSRRASRS